MHFVPFHAHAFAQYTCAPVYGPVPTPHSAWVAGAHGPGGGGGGGGDAHPLPSVQVQRSGHTAFVLYVLHCAGGGGGPGLIPGIYSGFKVVESAECSRPKRKFNVANTMVPMIVLGGCVLLEGEGHDEPRTHL
jgi:hypothetical protein